MNDIPAPTGPLRDVRVIEFAGIGPGPFAGMLLADMGADVIVIERAAVATEAAPANAMNRGKRSVALDLKSADGRDAAWRLLDSADALIEGYRPGVMERLGFGPDAVAARCPRLVYGRVTGWGQTGPLAHAAGHDINYVALTGELLRKKLRAGSSCQAPLPRIWCTSAPIAATPSIIAASTTWPRPLRRASISAQAMPKARNIAPPPMSPTSVAGITGAWPGRHEVDSAPVSAT